MKERLPTYGGQAVIEGVLMRGTRYIAMAMRAPDKTIHLYEEELGGIYKKGWMTMPFLRGITGLWDALILRNPLSNDLCQYPNRRRRKN